MEFYDMLSMVFALFFFLGGGTLVMLRWFRHREVMAMIRQGILPPEVAKKQGRKQNGQGFLAWGIGISMIGMALLCATFPIMWLDSGWLSFGPIHLPGILVLFMGLALVIIFVVNRQMSDARPRRLASDEFDDMEEGWDSSFEAKVSHDDE